MNQPTNLDSYQTSISGYLLERLKGLGVDHLFGIPGDFILPFYQVLMDSELEHIAACNELDCGYAADGYAREKGLGAIAVTYGAGSFCTVNAIAGAYAESVPLVLISGGPEAANYKTQPTTHHTLPNKFDASINIFEQITAYSVLIDDVDSAPAKIDEALAICVRMKKPVYLEIPMDVQTQLCAVPTTYPKLDSTGRGTSDGESLKGAMSLLSGRLKGSAKTAILLGQEVRRSGLHEAVVQLVRHTNIPVISMLDEKAYFVEHLDQCVGIYQGGCSNPEVKAFVESADTLVFLGVVDSDFNLGGATADLNQQRCVWVFDGKVRANNISFDKVSITDLVEGLIEELPADMASMESVPQHRFFYRASDAYEAKPETAITSQRLHERLAHFVQSKDIVVADGPAAINAAQIQMPEGSKYFASSYWAAIGHGFAASLGTCVAAAEDRRVLVFVGDGSFQICAQELSSMVRYGVTPIVFLMNNKGYTAERLIHDGEFNDVADWKYHKLGEVFGGVAGIEVFSEGDLETALEQADRHNGPGPLLIEVHLDPYDVSDAFKLLSEKLR